MQKFLIPLFACLLFGIPSVMHAQTPREIGLPPGPIKYPSHPAASNADMMCNAAGTYTLAQFIGNSNDTDLPQIFLCAGDSFLLRHNGDAILTGDPDANTPPGIAYALYKCQPTIMGDDLQAISLNPGPGDACLWDTPFPVNGFYITQGVPNGGDSWFFNSGAIITAFGMNQPVEITFAPITVDEIVPPAGFESATVGAPPGPCVNVNTAAAFRVVYLNPITADGVITSNGNDCLGRFTVRGGYPEFDNSSIYTINIFLTSDPNVKAVIHTQNSQLFHLAPVIFSVPQAGEYTVVIEDGKGCPFTTTIDMDVCDAVDNVVLDFPDTIAVPGSTNFCVPITVENFEIISASFSINWDPNVLQYTGLSNLNPILDPFTASTLNDVDAASGQLGLIIYDLDVLGNVLNVPNGEALFEVCFDAVGALGDCTGLLVTNNPTAVGFEDETGQPLAVTSDTGSVCINFTPLDFTVDIIDTTCLGTATMVVTATGGAGTFDVVVTEFCPTAGPTFAGTISGVGASYTIVNNVGNFNNVTSCYSVCVTDTTGTTLCDTVNVAIPTLGAQISFIQTPTCNGLENDIIEAVILVGGSPVANPGPQYTYSWSPTTVPNPNGALQDGTLAGGVPSANYTLIVTDTVLNCSAPIASGFLGQPLPIGEDVVTATPASCTGIANGSLSYTVEGGTPNPNGHYQFAWEDSNGMPVGAPGLNNPIVLNGLSSGTYTVTITDNNLCTFIDSVIITDQKSVELNPGTIQLPVSCFGLSDGGASVAITEFPPTFGSSYTFVWDPMVPGATQNNLNLSSSYTPLPAGDYTVTATDANGCSATTTVTVIQPNELVLDTLGIQGPGCGQANTGSINVVALGGTGGPNYTYNWDIPATGANQSGLGVGTYNVTVVDINGCRDSLVFTLDPPAPPALSVTEVAVRCGGDGSLTAIAPTAVSYNWASLPAGTMLGTTTFIENLAGGTYAVTVTDGFSCTAADTITLADVIPLSFADTSFVEPTCFGSNNGILGVVVQNGQAPYVQYNWSPASTPPVNGPTLPSLVAGVYQVTVTDNVGCTLTGSFTLNQPPQIVLALSGIQDASCFGICDGQAIAAANYATTPPTTGNFTYIWSDGNSSTGTRTDLCPGMITVTAADQNNCNATQNFTINSPTQVTGAATTTPTSCFGVDDGTATIQGAGGNGSPYSVVWSNGSTGATATGLPAGPYTATVTDANGCTGTVAGIAVGQPAEIVVLQDLLQTDNPKCFGDDDGMIAVTVSGGNVGQLTYAWSDGTGVIGNTPEILEEIPAGTYSVVVTDSEGCTGSLSNIILQDPPPVLGDYEDPEALLCHGDETTLRVDTIFGGSGGPYQFSLDYGALLDPGFPVSIGGGEHYLTYFDVNGCSYTDTIDIVEPDLIEVVFEPNVWEIELGDTTYQLKPLITGAAVDTFLWSPAEYLRTASDLNPYVYTFESQVYTLVVFDDKGCSGEGSITINVDPNRNVYVPNVFKPGVGGLNDHFNVYLGVGIEMVNYMRVYDRWGELMFSRERFLPNNDNFADGWDGRFNGDYVNPGVFVYIIEVKFLDGRVLLYRGDVTVVR